MQKAAKYLKNIQKPEIKVLEVHTGTKEAPEFGIYFQLDKEENVFFCLTKDPKTNEPVFLLNDKDYRGPFLLETTKVPFYEDVLKKLMP